MLEQKKAGKTAASEEVSKNQLFETCKKVVISLRDFYTKKLSLQPEKGNGFSSFYKSCYWFFFSYLKKQNIKGIDNV